MPAILLLVLEFVKKYWVYFVIAGVVLGITAYASHVIHEAHMYKTEKAVVAKQQASINQYNIVLQKQKDYTADIQGYQNDVITKAMKEQNSAVTQKSNFDSIVKSAPSKPTNQVSTDVTGGFNDLFDGFNDAK